MYHYLSFTGGSDCENGIQAGAESMYLPSQLSCVRMRQDEHGDGGDRKANFAGCRGTEREQQIQKCKIKNF